MPRPTTSRFSSSNTAFVVVEPRSMPTNVFIGSSSGGGERASALLLDHLKIALQAVFDVGRREIARIDEIRFDERRRLAGAFFHLAHNQKLACRKAVAALDRIDQQSV